MSGRDGAAIGSGTKITKLDSFATHKKGARVDLKTYFLNELYSLLDDGRVRYFVPEVNSRVEHLDAIVRDLVGAGFGFGLSDGWVYLSESGVAGI